MSSYRVLHYSGKPEGEVKGNIGVVSKVKGEERVGEEGGGGFCCVLLELATAIFC